jgi:DNA-binding response OmpR family regulator
VSEEARILIVETDILVRHPLAEYLRECGYIVVEACDVTEARSLLEHDEVLINIVLAEGNTGFELSGWIRANHPEVKVILAGTVARAAEKAGDLCEDGPALALPYEHKFVLERIRRLLAARDRSAK